MTLGEPQPLSRRQAREKERIAETAAVQVILPVLDVPTLKPATVRASSRGDSVSEPSSRRASRDQGATPTDDQSGALSVQQVTPTPPSPAKLDPASDRVVDSDVVAATPPPSANGVLPTLSRRERRAQYVLEDAEQGSAAAAVPAPREAPSNKLANSESPQAVHAPLLPKPEARPPGPRRANAGSNSVPTGWTPPVGHWSIDRDADVEEAPQPDQSLDELINRGIGAGGIPTTTNALILPAIPHQPGNTSAISNTGEIMITGSFDLPRSLGSTGAHPNLFDSSEMDHLMDQLDADQMGGDSAPVSASRAVSTHASTRGMLTPPKRQRASLPMILVVVTAVLAVAVLALFVTGYLAGTF